MANSNPRRLAVALAIVTAGATLAVPAGAQFSNGRSAFDQRPRVEPVQFPDFFRFFDNRGPANRYNPYNPYNPFNSTRPPRTIESDKAPPPRKVETPPTSTVLVIGDLFADWLGYGLEEAFADTAEIGIVRKIRPYSGLVRYETRADAPEWSQAVKDVLAMEKPTAIVVMLGVNDRLPLRDHAPPHPGAATTSPQGQGATPSAPSSSDTAQPDSEQSAIATNKAQRQASDRSYEFHTDQWAELYDKRIDDMIAALKSKGVPVLWVGLPAIRGTRSTSDMSYLDERYRARAEKAGITYVDIWDGFVDENGRYAVQGPDFEGQIRRLRTIDGVYFTKAGAVKLGHYVEHELRRVLSSHVVPVALPGPEEQAPKENAVGARPAIGPVVPLAATGSGEGGDLLGATSNPTQRVSDPIGARVLIRGDAIAAPPGRADDFSWPRADTNANDSADVTPAPAPPVPAAPLAKDVSGKTDTNKNDANKNHTKTSSDAKSQPAPNSPPAKPHRKRQELDGAPPRPPLPIGPAADSTR